MMKETINERLYEIGGYKVTEDALLLMAICEPLHRAFEIYEKIYGEVDMERNGYDPWYEKEVKDKVLGILKSIDKDFHDKFVRVTKKLEERKRL